MSNPPAGAFDKDSRDAVASLVHTYKRLMLITADFDYFYTVA